MKQTAPEFKPTNKDPFKYSPSLQHDVSKVQPFVPKDVKVLQTLRNRKLSEEMSTSSSDTEQHPTSSTYQNS